MRDISLSTSSNFLSSNRRNCRQDIKVRGEGRVSSWISRQLEISWEGASGFRDRIRRRAVFEKLGYGRTGAVTLISAHLCPRLRVHVLRVSRPAKHRNRAQCTAEFHSVYTHAGARACAHKFAFSIVTYLGLRTSGSSSRLFTLPSRKLLVHDYIFFLFSLSLPPRNTPPKSKSLFEKILGGEFFLGFFSKNRRLQGNWNSHRYFVENLFVLFFDRYDKWNRKREREKGFVFVKNLSLEETSSKLFYFFFFSLVSLTRGVMPGYLIIFCKMNFSFLLFYASLIMIYRVILMSPGWSRFAIGRNWSLTSRLRKILEPLWPFLKLNREISPRRDLFPFFFFLVKLSRTHFKSSTRIKSM